MRFKYIIAAIALVLVSAYIGDVIGYNLKKPSIQSVKSAEKIATPDDLLSRVNAARSARHIASLRANTKLVLSAGNKCSDMAANKYWEHTSPAGLDPAHFVSQVGYDYSTGGENFYEGDGTPEGIMDAWMASKSHREAILNPAYIETGIAICSTADGQIMVVEHFATPV